MCAISSTNERKHGRKWNYSWQPILNSAASYLFGQRGLIRQTFKPWREYLRADFHPNQQASDLSARWLADNARAYSTVGAAA